MKGFKALNKDLTPKYREMKYEIGKWYKIDGKLEMCRNGFHFCERLIDVSIYYNIDESKIFEVEIDGKIIHGNDKSVAEKIKLVREISIEEFRKYIEDNLDELVNDEFYEVRCEVAMQGYGLDKLVGDEDCDVRAEVARQGYGLDKLVDDKNWFVRREVARQGYRLNKLIDDKDYDVRSEVAKQGYGLDRLVDDEDYDVRREVAKQGYRLDKLVDDEIWLVRAEVAGQGYGLDKLIDDEDGFVRCEVARQGYGLDRLVDDEIWFVREATKCQLRQIIEKDNDFDIIFYTSHCPKCQVLEKKLKELDIKYETETNKVPVLCVGGKLYNFKEAVDFLKLVEKEKNNDS